MKELISEKLEKIMDMIQRGDSKDKIEIERKELDELLNNYLKDI